MFPHLPAPENDCKSPKGSPKEEKQSSPSQPSASTGAVISQAGLLSAWHERTSNSLPIIVEPMGDETELVVPEGIAAQMKKLSTEPAPAPKRFYLGAFERTLQQAADFEGYKLNTTTNGTHRIRLSTMVYRHQPSLKQMSVQHLRLLAETNMLFVDTWSIRTIMDVRLFMILDDGCLHRVIYNSARNTVSEVQKVMTLYPPRRDRSLPPSLHFVSSTCAVVCDGGRVLTFYETNNHRSTWEAFFEYRIIGPQAPGTKPGCDRPPAGFDFGFVIMDARLTMKKQTIDVCLRGVRDYEDDRPSENFIRWITVEIADPKVHHWTLKRAKSIVCPGDLEFVGFDRSCDHLITVGCKPPVVESEEDVPVIERDPSLTQVLRDRDNDKHVNKILYVWLQTEHMVKVYCRLEQEGSHLLKQEDITFEATETRLLLKAKDTVIFDGELGGPIETDATHWELWKPMEGMRRIEFTFKKKQQPEAAAAAAATVAAPDAAVAAPDAAAAAAGGAAAEEKTEEKNLWLEVVKGDGRGKHIDDAEDIDWCMQALDIEFTDNEMPISYYTAARDRPSTLEKMEECDIDETERYIWYLNETTNHVDHYTDLTGQQVLFATRAFPPLCLTRALCIREGDNGYVYNFEIFPPRHIQVLKAFGHVMTGKPHRRYSSVSPHGGYAVVVDRERMAYAYWQSNAQTGDLDQYREMTQRPYDPADIYCPMQVVNMRANAADEEVDDEIMGYIATEDTLILLSSDTLVFHRLRVPPVKWAKSAEESDLPTN